MGNYSNLEYDFVDRTLRLVAQYEQWMNKVAFNEQYNYTLLLNCLLGVIVMPKERIISSIPQDRITKKLKEEMGISESTINADIVNLRELIVALRHSIAHFDVEVISIDIDNRIDEIVFKDEKAKGAGYEVIRFKAYELLPFIRYYSGWLMSNLKLRPEFRHK